jgi:hypothetical protein
VADELIQGTVVIDQERGTADARYFVSFYPAPPDHRPCVKSQKGICFEKPAFAVIDNYCPSSFGAAPRQQSSARSIGSVNDL